MAFRVFIGSSSEGISVARAIVNNFQVISEEIHTRLWELSFFKYGTSTLESLIVGLQSVDYAIFVLTPDDVAKIRGQEQSVPRDNVIFELGLAIGTLGPDRVFFVRPARTRVLSDLAGIVYGSYNNSDSDKDQALSGFCNKVYKEILTRNFVNDQSIFHDIQTTYSIQHINEVGDARIKTQFEIASKGAPISSRTHTFFCDSNPATAEDIELRAWDGDGRPLRCDILQDYNNRKRIKIYFRNQLRDGDRLIYTYSYFWPRMFPPEETYYIIKSTAQKVFFEIERPIGWEILKFVVRENLTDSENPQRELIRTIKEEGSNTENFYSVKYELEEFDNSVTSTKIEWDFDYFAKK